MTPYVEVAHLPSSSSFFSAILQPLGLRYISSDPTDDDDDSQLQSLVGYGPDPDNIVLQVRQSEHPLKPPRLSSVVISAPSKSAVSQFHSCWLKADPPSWSLFRDDIGLELVYDDRQRALRGPFQSNQGGVSGTRAIVYDHSGNRLEVVYDEAPRNRNEAPRVLDWKHTFAPQKTPSSRIGLKSNMAPAQSQSRSHATSSSPTASRAQVVRTQQAVQSATPRESSFTDALNTTTVVGAVLGLAAGAALTYGFVSNNSSPSREEPHGQEPEPLRGAGLPRRATFPEKPVTSHYSPPRYDDGKKRTNAYSVPRRFADPDFQPFGHSGGHLNDGDGDMDYGVTPAPPSPRYLTQGPLAKSDVRSRASSRSRPVEDKSDSRSRHSTRSIARPTSRARSETPRERAPLTLSHDWERRSHAPSRRSAAPESAVSRPPLSRTHRSNIEPDRESYVSARSHRSKSTTRPPTREPRGSEYETATRRSSRAPSQVSATTIREIPMEMPVRASSHVSARRIPLPRSAVGSSHAHWDPWEIPLPGSGVGSSHANWDDDMISLAPSDSISCAGSKRRSRKSRH